MSRGPALVPIHTAPYPGYTRIFRIIYVNGSEDRDFIRKWNSVNQMGVTINAHMLMYRHTELQQTFSFTADGRTDTFVSAGYGGKH